MTWCSRSAAAVTSALQRSSWRRGLDLGPGLVNACRHRVEQRGRVEFVEPGQQPGERLVRRLEQILQAAQATQRLPHRREDGVRVDRLYRFDERAEALALDLGQPGPRVDFRQERGDLGERLDDVVQGRALDLGQDFAHRLPERLGHVVVEVDLLERRERAGRLGPGTLGQQVEGNRRNHLGGALDETDRLIRRRRDRDPLDRRGHLVHRGPQPGELVELQGVNRGGEGLEGRRDLTDDPVEGGAELGDLPGGLGGQGAERLRDRLEQRPDLVDDVHHRVDHGVDGVLHRVQSERLDGGPDPLQHGLDVGHRGAQGVGDRPDRDQHALDRVAHGCRDLGQVHALDRGDQRRHLIGQGGGEGVHAGGGRGGGPQVEHDRELPGDGLGKRVHGPGVGRRGGRDRLVQQGFQRGRIEDAEHLDAADQDRVHGVHEPEQGRQAGGDPRDDVVLDSAGGDQRRERGAVQRQRGGAGHVDRARVGQLGGGFGEGVGGGHRGGPPSSSPSWVASAGSPPTWAIGAAQPVTAGGSCGSAPGRASATRRRAGRSAARRWPRCRPRTGRPAAPPAGWRPARSPARCAGRRAWR